MAVVLGAYLITRPTTSLDVLAIAVGVGFVLQGVIVLDSEDEGPPPRRWESRARVAVAVLWVSAGVFVLLFLGLTVRLLAEVIAIALVANGILQLIGAFRRSLALDARIAAIAFGAASFGFGILAGFWPDITLLIAAVAFGAQLIISGIAEGRHALHGAPPERTSTARPLHRFARTTAAVVSLALVGAAGVVSIGLRGATPVVDEFYAAPRDVPDEPGQLIRSEPFSRDVPSNATAWRILYTTTRGDGSPAVASGIVVAPTEGIGYRPVIGWAHGTTGFAQPCAPSLLERPFASGTLFVLTRVIEAGWALVATDYIGLGTAGPHPYLIGRDSAHAILDALRASRQLTPGLIGGESVIWGHSQGGGAALWAGALAEDYAPLVSVEGVAALAPASELNRLITQLSRVRGGSVIESFALASFAANYHDVTWREYVRHGAEPIVRAISERCLTEPGVLISGLEGLALRRDPAVFKKNPLAGPFGARIMENIPPATVSAPLLVAQGEADELIPPRVQQAFIERIREAGQDVDYRTYPGRDHITLVYQTSPLMDELFAWSAERFAGVEGVAD
ncbi:lipase family protein [Ruicaihuangia caeni]|uniref:Alpha/beta fold hydrolase n=1 Tax=Ruicaihuangia caeni TaxID=3042517 RepID=A0AAW6T682_9MICO|nr:lipase family protein [Klugiella sp. YN-L-19]MDI2098186.1 alpha/beta fold hydrolase [Klugiella sp. YN-L-19]